MSELTPDPVVSALRTSHQEEMSSSEPKDEELERLRAAVAPNFSIGVADSAGLIDSTNSLNGPLTNGHGNGELRAGLRVDVLGKLARWAKYPVLPDKPSLRPDKQKDLNSADTLDLDGFTPQFKDHISKKLTIKLDAGISMDKDDNGGDETSRKSGNLEVNNCVNRNDAMTEEEEESEKDGLAVISVFSISARKSFIRPSNHETTKTDNEKRKRAKKRREDSLGEYLKQIHLSKKIRAVKAVVRAEALGREELIDHLDLANDDDDCGSEKEEEKRLSSMAVSGEAILSASMIRISDKNCDAAATKKKKKKKKKTAEGDDVGAVECKELNGEELNGESNVALESKTGLNSDSTPKKYKRKKKGKQERLKARLRLEQRANGVAPAEETVDCGNQ